MAFIGSTRAGGALLMFVVMAGCAKTGGGVASGGGNDEAAIRAIDAEWVKATTAEQFASYYADDGTLMPPGGPIVAGRSGIQKAVAGLMALPGFALTFAPTTVNVAGDGAFELGDYTLTTKDKDGKPQTAKGKYVVVWRRQADGQWKVEVDAPTTTQ